MKLLWDKYMKKSPLPFPKSQAFHPSLNPENSPGTQGEAEEILLSQRQQLRQINLEHKRWEPSQKDKSSCPQNKNWLKRPNSKETKIRTKVVKNTKNLRPLIKNKKLSLKQKQTLPIYTKCKLKRPNEFDKLKQNEAKLKKLYLRWWNLTINPRPDLVLIHLARFTNPTSLHHQARYKLKLKLTISVRYEMSSSIQGGEGRGEERWQQRGGKEKRARGRGQGEGQGKNKEISDWLSLDATN